jgi:hypothetical protein
MEEILMAEDDWDEEFEEVEEDDEDDVDWDEEE